MPTQQEIQIPAQVAGYLQLHHIITIGTSSITGMPHAATTAYASGDAGVYFSMRPDELTIMNVAANHWASFTIDDYTPDFRKVRELNREWAHQRNEVSRSRTGRTRRKVAERSCSHISALVVLEAPRCRQLDIHARQVDLRGDRSQGAGDHAGGKG